MMSERDCLDVARIELLELLVVIAACIERHGRSIQSQVYDLQAVSRRGKTSFVALADGTSQFSLLKSD